MGKLNIETVPIDSIHPDPSNARVHPSKNLESIKGSLCRFGQQKPIVVGIDNVIRAGNGTWEAAKAIGWNEIQIVRTELQGSEATAYSIADNRTCDLATWNLDILEAELSALTEDGWTAADLEKIGFADGDLEALVEEAEKNTDGSWNKIIEDVVPEPPETAISRTGDLWILGEHRLLCGDSTKPEDITRLMQGENAALLSTDPPYCVNYTGTDRPIHDGKPSGKDWSHVYREVDIADLGQFLDGVFTACLPVIDPNSAVYIWHAHVQQPVVAAAFERHGLLFHQVIIWVKPTATFGHSYYRWRHEPCAFGWQRGSKPLHGGGMLDTIWEIDWEGRQRVSGNEHPTQKPVRLFEIPMEQHTKSGAIVLEPFSGSGSQLIAAEKLGRRCRAMEIAPAFVDVAVRRWETATGKEAIMDGIQKTFAQISIERQSYAAETESRLSREDEPRLSRD